jgi:hypothetical protein
MRPEAEKGKKSKQQIIILWQTLIVGQLKNGISRYA